MSEQVTAYNQVVGTAVFGHTAMRNCLPNILLEGSRVLPHCMAPFSNLKLFTSYAAHLIECCVLL